MFVMLVYRLQSAEPVSCVLYDLAHEPEGSTVRLVELCRKMLKGQYYGGQLVDSAVNAIFAALIWNSQDCRGELDAFGKGVNAVCICIWLIK